MASMKTCMNVLCGAPSSTKWRDGWVLQSGGSALLCDNCGSAFEQSIFCNMFHSNDSGWRECTKCGKRLHCGCIASRCLLELLDGGGVICVGCARSSGVHYITTCNQKTKHSDMTLLCMAGESRSTSVDFQVESDRNHMQLGNHTGGVGLGHLVQFQNDDKHGSFGQRKSEGFLHNPGEIGSSCCPTSNQVSDGSSQSAEPVAHGAIIGTKDMYESLAQTSLRIALGSPLQNSNLFPGVAADERGHNKASSPFQQGLKSRQVLSKAPKSTIAQGVEGSMGVISQMRVARPPAEGRGRNQLLPRYWPRITDKELQQISGDTNSTIVPLFEKVLSASDAGRIGRLVLPKACAEAYFPPISQPEGLPIRIQDVKGKEWVFQFRFWPNNNSRMYVLEGVTPCIQSMQLQAGDTVTFSRMDPEGKLVMGFRKASNSISVQDIQPSANFNGGHASETCFPGIFENQHIISGYAGLLQSFKGSPDPHLNSLSNLHNGDISWLKSEKQEDETKGGLLLPSMLIPEKKRVRNIGSKSKRLLLDSEDVLELKFTWEEAQDLLCAPSTAKPSIVTVEDHDFEEYDEPPVFGKRSIFVVCSTGAQEQWVQCDSCYKWRRLPASILLPPKWTCEDNFSDQSRCSCSTPDELTQAELENILRSHNDLKKQRMLATQEHESSRLDSLADAAILKNNITDPSTTGVATTTRHPRHRPGCSCIVCIQPPSGKGKHKPTCTCNVCMTVKRRFKTLMMRKKKRQSEREAEIAHRSNQQTCDSKYEAEADDSNEIKLTNEVESKVTETGMGKIDLNSNPVAGPQVSMMSLLQVANLPLETYLKRNGLTSLMLEQEMSLACLAPLQVTGETEAQVIEDSCIHSSNEESSEGEENVEPLVEEPRPDPSPNDPQ